MKVDARLASASGRWVSVEEQTLLENAALAIESRGLDNLQFWGKVLGAEADYLILVAQNKLEEEQDYPNQSFFFCTNKSFKLKPLVPATAHAQVARTTPFTGNPDTELVPAVEGEGEEGEEETKDNSTPAYTEANHLASVVAEIHHHTAVVPRGAFVADPCHKVARNKGFGGLDAAEASDVASYFHFRKPVDPTATRGADGLIRPDAFLDKISSTHPEGAWSCQIDASDSTAVLRSLLYPGYTFYHEVGTGRFGGAYVGDGSKNRDIAFML